MNFYKKHVFVCVNQKAPGKTCCANTGGEPFFDYLKTQLKEKKLHGEGLIRVSKSGCLGRCNLGPCMVIYPEGIWYKYTSLADIDEIIAQHFISGHVVERLQLS